MKGLNKKLVLPTLLVGCVLVAGGVLAQSNSTLESDQTFFVGLPVIPDSITQESKQKVDQLATEQDSPASTQVTTSTQPTAENPATTQDTPSQQTVETTTVNTPTEQEVAAEVPETPKQIQVKLVIQGPGISLNKQIQIDTGVTVYQLLKTAQQRLDFSMKISQHSSLGIFVEGFNGILNNPKTNHYWLYYLNGQFAARGVSIQTVTQGDIIKWSYE